MLSLLFATPKAELVTGVMESNTCVDLYADGVLIATDNYNSTDGTFSPDGTGSPEKLNSCVLESVGFSADVVNVKVWGIVAQDSVDLATGMRTNPISGVTSPSDATVRMGMTFENGGSLGTSSAWKCKRWNIGPAIDCWLNSSGLPAVDCPSQSDCAPCAGTFELKPANTPTIDTWMDLDYDDSDWEVATVYSQGWAFFDCRPFTHYLTTNNMTVCEAYPVPQSEWIFTADNLYSDYITCRYVVDPEPTPTPAPTPDPDNNTVLYVIIAVLVTIIVMLLICFMCYAMGKKEGHGPHNGKPADKSETTEMVSGAKPVV